MLENYVATINLRIADDTIPNAKKAFARIWTPALQSYWKMLPLAVTTGNQVGDMVHLQMNAVLLGHVQEYHPDAVALYKTFGPGGLRPWDPGSGPLHEGDWVTMEYERSDGTRDPWRLPGAAPFTEVQASCYYIQVS